MKNKTKVTYLCKIKLYCASIFEKILDFIQLFNRLLHNINKCTNLQRSNQKDIRISDMLLKII